MLTCAFFKNLNDTVHTSVKSFIFKRLFAKMLHRVYKETTFNKIREIWGCFWIGSIDEKSPFVYISVSLFDETLNYIMQYLPILLSFLAFWKNKNP